MALLCLALGGGMDPAAAAQEMAIPEVVYPNLLKQADSAEGFVPEGWALEAQASGDLNRDGVGDLALVLRQRNPVNVLADSMPGGGSFDTNPRILAVAFRNGLSGPYALQAENHTLIPRHENPTQEDPFDAEGGISIERGGLRVILRLFMTAGGWETFTATFTFQHRNARFELIGYDRSNVHRASGETHDVSANYLTGKIKRSAGHISSDDPAKVVWKTLPRRVLPTLDTIGDGLEFRPNVFRDEQSLQIIPLKAIRQGGAKSVLESFPRCSGSPLPMKPMRLIGCIGNDFCWRWRYDRQHISKLDGLSWFSRSSCLTGSMSWRA